MVSKLERKIIDEEWAKYKYTIMERSYKFYKEISQGIASNAYNPEEFMEVINRYLQMQPEKRQVINTLQHVWGYFKRVADGEEKAVIFKLIEQYKEEKCTADEIKKVLHKYAVKYNVVYLLNSYFFSK